MPSFNMSLCVKGLHGLLLISALTVLVLLLLVALAGLNMGGDTFIYHLPFAGRIYGITPENVYGFQYAIEQRFAGFPLLAERIQGLFWSITGRPQSSDLLCYFSLILFFIFLKSELKIPVYLSVPALLAVPMIYIHASSSYVDLPSNVAVSILFLSVYLCYVEPRTAGNRRKSALIIFSAAAAVNMKFQVVPVVMIGLCLYALCILKDVIQEKNKDSWRKGLCFVVMAFFLVPFIFASEVKNTIVYGNPFYPLHMKVAGFEFKGPEELPVFMPENLKAMSPYARWAKSLFEIGAFDARRPYKWTLGMDFLAMDDPHFAIGGYFAPYVIFNLLLMGYLGFRLRNTAFKYAFALMTILTLYTPLMPQCYELRYTMYWIMVLIALNAYFVCKEYHTDARRPWHDLLGPTAFACIACIFMFVFIKQTRNYYAVPQMNALQTFIHNDREKFLHNYSSIDDKVIQGFKDNDRVCLVGSASSTYLYNSFFHPEKNYYIKSEFALDEPQVTAYCEKLKIVRVP